MPDYKLNSDFNIGQHATQSLGEALSRSADRLTKLGSQQREIQAAKEQQIAKQEADRLQQSNIIQANKEAALAKELSDKGLITHKSNVERDANNEAIRKLLGVYGYKEGQLPPGTDISMPGGGSIKAPDPASSTPKLTPAQTAAEKSGGEKYAEYTVGGGRATLDRNIEDLEDVAKELTGGKSNRNLWDRTAGAIPVVKDYLAGDEVSRQDRVKNSIQKSLRQILGSQYTEREGVDMFNRAYNPRLSSQENATRVLAAAKELRDKRDMLEKAGERYNKTGYATIDINGQSTQPTQPNTPNTQDLMKKLQELEARRPKDGVN